MRKGSLTQKAIAAAEQQGKTFVWDQRVAGLGLRLVRSRGGGRVTARTWLYRYRDADGRQRFYKLGRFPEITIDKAQRLAGQAAGRVAEARLDPDKLDPQAHARARKRAAASEISVRALWEAYERERVPEKAPASQRKDRQNWRNYIEPKIGDRPIREISKEEARSLLAGIKAAGKPGAALKVQTLCSGMWTWGVETDPPLVPDGPNPWSRPKRRRGKGSPAEAKTKDQRPDGKHGYALSDAEYRVLFKSIDACAASKGRHAPYVAIKIAALTGPRGISEILPRRWRDVDWQNGLFWLSESKTSSTGEYIMLSDDAIALLHSVKPAKVFAGGEE